MCLPIVVYGDKETPIDIAFEGVCVELADDYTDEALFWTANLKKLSLQDFTVKNFKGNTVLKNYGKNEGEIVLTEVKGIDGISVVTETDEVFTVDMI